MGFLHWQAHVGRTARTLRRLRSDALTRKEAIRLVDSIDGMVREDLVAAASASGAGALATVPLTLNLLARTFNQRGDLNLAPSELFALGVRQLLDEHVTAGTGEAGVARTATGDRGEGRRAPSPIRSAQHLDWLRSSWIRPGSSRPTRSSGYRIARDASVGRLQVC
jgi:hypothetical protein